MTRLLGPSRTFLDGSWVKTSKSKRNQNIVNETRTRESNRPLSSGTSVARTTRPQSSLFAQSTHHSTEIIPEFIICLFSSSFNRKSVNK